MKRLGAYFLQGLVVITPVAITVYIVYVVVTYIDALVPITLPAGEGEEPRKVPGLGFVAVMVLIPVVGFLTSNFLGRALVGLVQQTLERLPLVKLIFRSIRDLVGSFVGDKKRFNKPVLVRLFPGSETKVVGFVTRDNLDFLGIADHVCVYLPQSYNFAGNLLVLPAAQIESLDAPSSDVMTFLVSGGVSGTEKRSAS